MSSPLQQARYILFELDTAPRVSKGSLQIFASEDIALLTPLGLILLAVNDVRDDLKKLLDRCSTADGSIIYHDTCRPSLDKLSQFLQLDIGQSLLHPGGYFPQRLIVPQQRYLPVQ